jgi:hypothetical protein
LNLNGATDVLYTNWEASWAYHADRPEGVSFECNLVGYQTAYSALVPGDYEKCVTNFYGSHANWPEVRIVDTLPSTDNGNGGTGDGNSGGSTTTPPEINLVTWIPGSTSVSNGDTVSYQGKCFIAKNNPGVWESPTQSNWFWGEVVCPSA